MEDTNNIPPQEHNLEENNTEELLDIDWDWLEQETGCDFLPEKRDHLQQEITRATKFYTQKMASDWGEEAASHQLRNAYGEFIADVVMINYKNT